HRARNGLRARRSPMAVVAGRSTRSSGVTMNEREDQPIQTGPSARAIALSRVSLSIWAAILVAAGIAIAVTGYGVDQLWGGAIAVLGLAHCLAARYASG